VVLDRVFDEFIVSERPLAQVEGGYEVVIVWGVHVGSPETGYSTAANRDHLTPSAKDARSLLIRKA
jgi:hypothetical protein